MDAFAGLAQVLSAKEEVLWKVDGRIWSLHLMMCYRNIQVHMGAKKHFGDSLKRLHHVMFRYHDVKTKDASMAWKHLQKGNEYKMSVLPPFDKRFKPIRATAHSNGETDFYKGVLSKGNWFQDTYANFYHWICTVWLNIVRTNTGCTSVASGRRRRLRF